MTATDLLILISILIAALVGILWGASTRRVNELEGQLVALRAREARIYDDLQKTRELLRKAYLANSAVITQGHWGNVPNEEEKSC